MSSVMRLDAPMGLLINRNKPIRFSFEGKQYQGLEGDSIASALLANDRWLLSRSFKYHRPRGPLTMAGQDANTLVQLCDEPNVLADRESVSEGLKVEGQNYNGTLDNDRDAILGHFGRFMPVGFYYRSFYKPTGIWNQWERAIRKKAGLGKLNLDFKPESYDKTYLFHDVVVVGSGPAGLSAALRVAESGAKVLLVEEQPILGGSLTYNRFDIEGLEADRLRNELVGRIEAQENITILTNATCNGWFADNYLPVIQGKRMYKVRAKECIIASGAFEQHVVFRNNDLPGIIMSSAANRLMKLYAVKPGHCAVILTGNDDGYFTALELIDNGVDVAAVIDMRSEPELSTLSEALRERGIPVKHGYTVYEAIAAKGKNAMQAVEVREITSRGEVGSEAEIISCDLLCMSAGYMPAYQLLCQAGAKLSYDDNVALFSLTNLPEHLHIAGSVNGIHTLESVLADGEQAAIKAINNLGLTTKSPTKVYCVRKLNFEWPIFHHPKGKDFVDYDEDLQVKDIVNATRLGYRDIQLVKRFSTVGMGPSQGRHSALPTARLVAQATERTVTETGVTTARPPFAPEKLAHLAGRGFEPYRHTAMHHRHLELGAKMITIANWQRPAFYGLPQQSKHSVESECRQVRSKVGCMDVSTLGGIDIRGPDAAEFKNRMYTADFMDQPVGQIQYAVMTNEHGVVMEDGLACRIAKEHFYMTASTSGVDRVYREMTRWNAQWCLDVDIANVTAAFAAINVTGPYARKVLEKLVNNVDLSPHAFKFMDCRSGHVFGVPVRLLRVGFVGELGYEIHVPAMYGEALWDVVMEAGQEYGIKPFGVEAQRLLRLEKGHILIGQDTDGMSHPGELSLEWAINKKKPFFVGCRSADILMAQKQTRKLVGFILPKQSLQPQEGHLVLDGEDISGNVTSCNYSPVLDAIIGLAYVGMNQSKPESFISIRVDEGQIVQAEIVKLPFYDPENKRQEL